MRTLRISICSPAVLIFLFPLVSSADMTLPAGGGQPFQNEQPSLTLNYIVNIAGEIDDLGEVGIFAGNFAPRGWALADGQPLNIIEYPDLYDKLGTTFGGDGINTFTLPDLRGRVPIGVGQGPDLPNYQLGQQVGGEQVTLGAAPAHAHGLGMGSMTESTGQALPHSNMQPSLALTPIIALEGVYPSRNISANLEVEDAHFGANLDPYLGEVTWIAHDDVPTGWMLADGQELQINGNEALYSLLGINYGGNGTVTFGLPDLRGRTSVGDGNGPALTDRSVGDAFGTTEETLTVGQMPSHIHDLPNNLGQTESTGGSDTQSNLQPSLTLTHIVATDGIYPSRNLTANQESGGPAAANLGSGNNPYIGSVSMFAGNFAPRGFLAAKGQIIPIHQNSALFSLLIDEYGGDGVFDFGLPDLRGRASVGMGQGTGISHRDLGDQYGVELSTLTETHLPSHAHEFTVLDGDFDLDGDVDGFDFVKWQRGESPNPLSPEDLNDWQTNYGAVAPLAATSIGVPEPATGIMLLIGMALMLIGRRLVVQKLNSA